HRHDLVPELDRGLVRRAHAADAGVVEEDVDAALSLRRVVGEALRRSGIGHVGDDRVGLAATRADLRDGLVRARAIDVGDDDACALPREEQRAGASDTRAGTGDDADLPVEASAHSAVNPPSTGSATPVMKPAAGVARKSTTDAISAGVASRPSGCAISFSRRNADGSGIASKNCCSIGVSTMPGQTAFTRMLSGAQSSASARASCTAAPFVAQ